MLHQFHSFRLSRTFGNRTVTTLRRVKESLGELSQDANGTFRTATTFFRPARVGVPACHTCVAIGASRFFLRYDHVYYPVLIEVIIEKEPRDTSLKTGHIVLICAFSGAFRDCLNSNREFVRFFFRLKTNQQIELLGRKPTDNPECAEGERTQRFLREAQ